VCSSIFSQKVLRLAAANSFYYQFFHVSLLVGLDTSPCKIIYVKSANLSSKENAGRQGACVQGWQSPFATETGGLFQTGNSVASAEQTSAALKLHKFSPPIYIGATTPLCKAGSGSQGKYINILARNCAAMSWLPSLSPRARVARCSFVNPCSIAFPFPSRAGGSHLHPALRPWSSLGHPYNL
jgi:hypothetical protein